MARQSEAAEIETEVVYVCSPDRLRQLRLSIQTLCASGSSFQRVTVYLLGSRDSCAHAEKAIRRFPDSRISVVTAAPLFGDYFHGNKLYACSRPTFARIVFLDTDTLVFRPIDSVWRDRPAAFIARPASAIHSPIWSSAAWSAAFVARNRTELPMFNSGFMIFQQGTHRLIEAEWRRAIEAYRARRYDLPWNDCRMFEQFGLPIALAQHGVTTAHMTPFEHRFGWEAGTLDDVVVLHTGDDRHETWTRRFNIPIDLADPRF